MSGPGRPKAIADDQLETLRQVVYRHRGDTTEAICKAFAKSTGIKVSTVTMRKAMRRACVRSLHPKERWGLPLQRRVLIARRKPAAAGKPTASARRRRLLVGCLTDAEWAAVADLFLVPEGHRGRPPKYERRVMVDACCYVVRTGSAWTNLPDCFPPWHAVHKSFSRWTSEGKLHALQQRLQQMWSVRLRSPER